MIHARRTLMVLLTSFVLLVSACQSSTPTASHSTLASSKGKSISGFHRGALAAYGISEITCSSVHHCVGYEGALSLFGSATPAHPSTSVVETDDGGKTWTPERFGGAIVFPIQCGDDTSCVGIYQSASSGSGPIAIVSDDGGVSWARTHAILRGDIPATLACPSSSHCLVVGTHNYFSTDGGVRWTLSSNPNLFFESDSVDLACPTASWCMTSTQSMPSGQIVFDLSRDGGKTWTQVQTSMTQSLNTLSCPDVGICTAVAPGAFHTIDQGKTWTAFQLPGTGSPWMVHCMSASDCLVFAVPTPTDVIEHGEDHTPLQVDVTHNGGKSWRVVQLGTGIVADDGSVSCPTTTTCFIAKVTGSILVTHDGGDTWQTIS